MVKEAPACIDFLANEKNEVLFVQPPAQLRTSATKEAADLIIEDFESCHAH